MGGFEVDLVLAPLKLEVGSGSCKWGRVSSLHLQTTLSHTRTNYGEHPPLPLCTPLLTFCSPSQLVRIRSKDGNFRFDLQPEDDFSLLLTKVSTLSTFLATFANRDWFPLSRGGRVQVGDSSSSLNSLAPHRKELRGDREAAEELSTTTSVAEAS